MLNGKNSEWHYITTGVPQGSVLGPLFFSVYINDLVDNKCSDAKLFADDTSLFKVVYDEHVSSSVLNNDLKTIKSWAFQWKMQFNPDPNKQAVQMIFSRKRTKPDHPQIFFKDTAVNQLPKHTHLGLTLDSELTFALRIREAITKARKGIRVLRFMSKYLHRDVLDQLYKLYVRPHLDYCDIIYHKHDLDLKLDFTKKLKSVQYSAALAVSGAWKGTKTDRIYEELGWESLLPYSLAHKSENVYNLSDILIRDHDVRTYFTGPQSHGKILHFAGSGHRRISSCGEATCYPEILRISYNFV